MQPNQRTLDDLVQHQLIPNATNEIEFERVETIYIPKFENLRQTSSNRYGKLLRELREREGFSHSELASYLNVEESLIRDLEAGSKRPYRRDVPHLSWDVVPGFTSSDSLALWAASAHDLEDETEENFTRIAFRIRYVEDQPYYGFLLKHKVLEYSLYLRADLSTDVAKAIESNAADTIRAAHAINQNFIARYWNYLSNASTEEAQVTLLRLSDVDVETYDIILEQSTSTTVKSGEYLTSPTPDLHGDPSTTQGTNAPEPGLVPPGRRERARKPARPEEAVQRQGVVFESPRSHYDNEYLEEHRESISQRFLAALENPKDALNPAAKLGLHVYAEAEAKMKGVSLSQASRDHHLPLKSLSRWVTLGLTEVLYKDNNAIYLPKATAQETARIYHEAKENGEQTARKLKEIKEKEAKLASSSNGIVYERSSTPDKKEGMPDRLVTVQELADTLHLPPSTAWSWLSSGRLQERGRVWIAKPGGRSRPLVSLTEAETLSKDRPPMGRPRKRGRRATNHLV